MPIYEYRCQSCGLVFENLQKLSDPDPEHCPGCGQPQVTRLLSAPSFRLAGSGWYETDFKKDGDRKRNLAGDSGADKPASDKPGADKPGSDKAAAPAPAAPAASPQKSDAS